MFHKKFRNTEPHPPPFFLGNISKKNYFWGQGASLTDADDYDNNIG